MFEDESSTRRRPRGFRKKQQQHQHMKMYGNATYYPECNTIATGNEIQSYPPQTYSSYEYSSSVASSASVPPPPSYVTQENSYFTTIVGPDNLTAYRTHATASPAATAGISQPNSVLDFTASYASSPSVYGSSAYNNGSDST